MRPDDRTPIASSDTRDPDIVVEVPPPVVPLAAGRGAVRVAGAASLWVSAGAAPPAAIGPPGSPVDAMRAPHMLQKRASSVFRAPHAWQKIIRRSLSVRGPVARIRGRSLLEPGRHDASLRARRGRVHRLAPRPTIARTVLRAIALLAVLAVPSLARAQGGGDTIYGRFDGDLVLSAGLGGGIAIADRRHPDVTGTTTIELRARLLDTGGLLVAPEWRPEGDSRVVIAVDLRPVFLVRFLLNAESGDRYLDLFVDSIGIDVGAAITPLDADVGVAFAFGWGVDVPIWVPERIGGAVSLRVGGRYVGALPGDQLGPTGGTDDVAILAVLNVRGVVDLGIAAWEPPRYRTPEDT